MNFRVKALTTENENQSIVVDAPNPSSAIARGKKALEILGFDVQKILTVKIARGDSSS